MNNHPLVLIPALLAASLAMAADPAKIDWGPIPQKSVPLFYPGQSSYEWVRSDAHKGAGREVKRGEACTSCHDEQDAEKDLGENIVKGGRLEPMPVKGKNGYVDLKVQAAYDDKNAYLRFQWKTQNPYPGHRAPVPALRRQGMESLRLSRSSTRWCRKASSPASTKTACRS